MTKTVRKMILDSLSDTVSWLSEKLYELDNGIDNPSVFEYELEVIESILKRAHDNTKIYIRWVKEDEETPFDPPYTIEDKEA